MSRCRCDQVRGSAPGLRRKTASEHEAARLHGSIGQEWPRSTPAQIGVAHRMLLGSSKVVLASEGRRTSTSPSQALVTVRGSAVAMCSEAMCYSCKAGGRDRVHTAQ